MDRDPERRTQKYQQYGSIGRVFVKRTARGIGSWFKAQVILFFVVLVILSLGLALLDIRWWGIKALVIAFLDVLPLIGSGLVMIPWSVIRLLSGQGTVALWLIVIYLLLILVRQILEPVIVGRSIGLKPIWTFLTTIIGIAAFGPIGAIIGAFVAILIRVFLTVRQDFLDGTLGSDPDDRDHRSYGGPAAGTPPDGSTVDPRRYRRAKDAGQDDDS